MVAQNWQESIVFYWPVGRISVQDKLVVWCVWPEFC